MLEAFGIIDLSLGTARVLQSSEFDTGADYPYDQVVLQMRRAA